MKSQAQKPKPFRVLLADDHSVLRQGLKQILRDDFKDIEFGEANDGRETLAQLEQPWDVLVLDINMPGMNGIEVIKEVRKLAPSLPVLVLTMLPEEQVALRVLQAGASGFLNKQTAPEELVAALRKVSAGGRYISNRTAEKLVRHMDSIVQKPAHERLSDREFQVMQSLAAGKTLKEIAGELRLSVKTISTFRARLLAKLKLQNNVELVHYAMEHGLLTNRLDASAG